MSTRTMVWTLLILELLRGLVGMKGGKRDRNVMKFRPVFVYFDWCVGSVCSLSVDLCNIYVC